MSDTKRKAFDPEAAWRSPDGKANAIALKANHPGSFMAIAELDALGHRILQRASSAHRADGMDRLVGMSMLRRSVTHFVGIRHLFEASAVEQTKPSLRAEFEGMLAIRYLIYGGQRYLGDALPTNARRREARARYFYVAAKRRMVYSEQALLDGRSGRVGVRPESRVAIADEIRATRNHLERHFQAQSAAFGPLLCFHPEKKRRKYHDPRKWYSFGFRRKHVNSVRALAGRFGWTWEYDVLYDAFSGLVHPSGIRHDAEIVERRLEIFSPYMAEAFPLLCKWSCYWQSYILTWAATAYHPDSIADVQDVWRRITPALDLLPDDIPAGLL
jgi:hypothetical protein